MAPSACSCGHAGAAERVGLSLPAGQGHGGRAVAADGRETRRRGKRAGAGGGRARGDLGGGGGDNGDWRRRGGGERTATAARRPACMRCSLVASASFAPSPSPSPSSAAAGLDRRTRPGGAVSVVRRRRTSVRCGSVQTTARWCRLWYHLKLILNIKIKIPSIPPFFFVVIRALARGARRACGWAALACPAMPCRAAAGARRAFCSYCTSAHFL